MVIEVTSPPEGGVGVNVKTDPVDAQTVPDLEGAVWAGLCTAINDYMRARGAGDFDCLHQHQRH